MTILTAAIIAAIATPTPATARCAKQCKQRVINKHKRRIVAPYRQFFERIAHCESGSLWTINTGNGFYGGIQFTLQSWRGVGGKGYPHKASKLEQMYRGVRLLKVQGPAAWPICSR